MKFIIALLSTILLINSLQGDEIILKQDKGKVVVNIDGNLFTEYLYANHGRSKPVLYPIIGPGGTRMTRDFPLRKALLVKPAITLTTPVYGSHMGK